MAPLITGGVLIAFAALEMKSRAVSSFVRDALDGLGKRGDATRAQERSTPWTRSLWSVRIVVVGGAMGVIFLVAGLWHVFVA